MSIEMKMRSVLQAPFALNVTQAYVKVLVHTVADSSHTKLDLFSFLFSITIFT